MDPSRINCEIFKDTWERRYEILVDKIHRDIHFMEMRERRIMEMRHEKKMLGRIKGSNNL